MSERQVQRLKSVHDPEDASWVYHGNQGRNLKLYELSIKILNGAIVPFSPSQPLPSGQTPTSTSPFFTRDHP
jgi:hypothetical protein